MKHIARMVFLSSLVLVLFLPAYAHGQELPNYYSVKFGGFFPDSNDFEDGFAGEVALGHYFSPNFALEVGLGYVWIGDFNGKVSTPYGHIGADIDVAALPLTATAKAVLPLKNAELYAGAGGGFYFLNASAFYFVFGIPVYYEDNDTAFGGHIMAGVQFYPSDTVFIGVEGKYTSTDSVTLNIADASVDVEVEGFSATAVLGWMF